MKTIILTLFFVIASLISTSCTNTTSKNSIQITTEDIDKIIIEPVSKKEEKGNYLYFFKLKNESPYLIKQNTVYLSYSIETKNGSKGNRFKVEAAGNKLDIHSGEEVLLGVFASKDGMGTLGTLMLDNPYIEIKGYFNDITIENSFGTSKQLDLKKFKEESNIQGKPLFVEITENLAYAEYLMNENKNVFTTSSASSEGKRYIRLLLIVKDNVNKDQAIKLGEEFASYIEPILPSATKRIWNYYNLTIEVKDEQGKSISKGTKKAGHPTTVWSSNK